jgi:single-strand DNA-binding protein
MNTIKLFGNVGTDLNVLTFDNGKKVSFSLSTTDTYTDKNNQPVKNTAWHQIAWGKIAEAFEQLVSKGKLMSIEGKIQYQNYTNSQNQKVHITEIRAFKVKEVGNVFKQ